MPVKFHAVLLMMILGSVSGAGPAHADESAGETAQHESRAKESPNAQPEQGTPGRRPVRTLEEFIPTEEISADKPVSFPVDI